MELSVVALVLLAALFHASWNALVKVNGDRLAVMTLITAGGGLICLPILPFLPPPDPASWPYLALSILWHTGYQMFLLQAYRHGDLGHVYPIARGAAPLLVLGLAWLVAGETVGIGQVAAIAVMAAGIISLAFRGGPPLKHDPRPVLYALGTAVFIASYTVTDGSGARIAGSPHSYTVWLFTLNAVPMTIIGIAARGRETAAAIREHWRHGMAGAALSLAAYWLVIWALTLGPMGPVSALRETSVILAAIIGAVFLKESFGRFRIAAAALVAVGIVLLRL